MSRLAVLSFLLLALACGCGLNEAPTAPASAALMELRAGNYDDAIRLATEAIKQTPHEAAPYLYRGRAYHYRNAMGDAHLAIADLTEAARLAPESSDVLYTRALVYRDLGMSDLADEDEKKARESDHLAREVFETLPDATPPSDVVKKIRPPEAVKGPQDRAKSTGEILRETAKSATPGEAQPAVEGFLDFDAESHVPRESEFNKQYRAMLGQTSPGEQAAPADPMTGIFGRAKEEEAAVAPSTAPALSGTPMSNGQEDAKTQHPLPEGWNRGFAPPLQSPFSQRMTPTTTSPPGMLPNIQSPFPQSNRSATGYVPPVNPFGGPGGQATGPAGINRPFSMPSSTPAAARPSNSAVRPLYPADFTP